jgi:hypothetical protein
MGTPKLYNLEVFYQLGVDPLTGLPAKAIAGNSGTIVMDARKALRIKDEQDAIHRYEWRNLPVGLYPELVERVLYYRGQGMLFKMGELFLFLPYAVQGSFDCYGRAGRIRPLVFGGSPATKTNGELADDSKVFLDTEFTPIYDENDAEGSNDYKAVILKDYTPQLNDHIIPRRDIQEFILQIEAEGIAMARTNRIANSGVKGMRVNDEGASENVTAAANSIVNAALTGKTMIPIVDEIEFQELGEAGAENSPEGYLMFIQSMDNLRLGLYGIKSGGLYQKKAHTLEGENDMNESSSESAYKDGLENRKRFCELANKAFGLNIEVSENPELESEGKPEDGGKEPDHELDADE